ncbi:hypothetical protein D1007_35234 [Hordeum vulgare]|uniref:F-box associated domain-containing protein n=1 Tax=Hordeum vulgare subsp. vulgare TaxID=112509 RepID=A0A8I6Y9C2_HORVV|nr:uncharacterized protein LOC123404898 [Hordeum vulgare subsp. vulgare]KAE8790463.1 hypothetical protein D1007_35234 [Hordeum vulgare]
MSMATADPCPCVVIAPQIKAADGTVTTAGFYRWEEGQEAATLVMDAMPDYQSFHPYTEAAHDLAHCDGLLLVPTAAAARVLNPATTRVLELPSSVAPPPPPLPSGRILGHHAFGLGRDSRSGAYKVARFFYRSLDEVELFAGGCTYTYALGAEVLTVAGVGADHRWRETAAPPPCPVIPGRTATFFEGSLLFTPHERVLGKEAPGFIRFRLDDEVFDVTPGPPRDKRIDYGSSSLAELRGELWMCVNNSTSPGIGSVEMWACGDLAGARWELRHAVKDFVFHGHRSLRPVTASAGAILLRYGPWHLWCYRRQGRQPGYGDVVNMRFLKYQRHDHNVVEYQKETIYTLHVIPYIPSLVPI